MYDQVLNCFKFIVGNNFITLLCRLRTVYSACLEFVKASSIGITSMSIIIPDACDKVKRSVSRIIGKIILILVDL